jgi:hypothetical protein
MKWDEHTLVERPIGKIRCKLPMTKKVFTEDYEIFEYEIINKKPVYRYLYSLIKETDLYGKI